MFIKPFLLLSLLLLIAKSNCKKYTNYTLFRGMPVNEEHLEYFNNLSDLYHVNFWRPPSTVYRPIEFALPPEEKVEFLNDAKQHDIYLTTVIQDLQGAFDKQTVKKYVRRKMDSFGWRNYYRIKDIYSWLKDLSKEHPESMKVFSIGKTHENRHIYAVQIIHPKSKRRSKVIIEGGIHAREWISTAFVTYMINEILLAPKSKNKRLWNVAMTYEFFFVPSVNPDGYEYSHIEDRLWRKNRQGTGVDLNRNFGFGFGTVGVSDNKNSEIYCGPQAFSEKETQALSKFVRARSSNLEYYIAFHSYGQFIIIPYAHLTQHLDNFDTVYDMGVKTAKNISRRYGTQYSVGTAYDTVGYKTSGVSACWVKKTFRTPYVVIFELRDNGQDGFALLPNKIIPTCQETMDGLVTLLTPRTRQFRKLSLPVLTDAQESVVCDVFVVLCNVLLFIIVRFD